MKNKKGFTLVELLAIIVILAVIMVIAVPKILDVVNGSKSSAWKDNVGMIKKAIVTNSQLIDVETGTYKYSIDKLCSDTSKVKEIVKLEDTNVTCSNNIFMLTGAGQFEGDIATIDCSDNKCNIDNIGKTTGNPLLKDLILSNQELDQMLVNAKTTYYYSGNVSNNYVRFSNNTWRIVRINEDNTIRLILEDAIDTSNHKFSTGDMYYTNSQIKIDAETWYEENIEDKNKVALGNFCEAAKVKFNDANLSGNASMLVYTSYVPDLLCNTDGNGKGLVKSYIGLLSYDEIVLAGAIPAQAGEAYYLYKNYYWWTMSPSGIADGVNMTWRVAKDGRVNEHESTGHCRLRPVINLKSIVTATGLGTVDDPYVVD